MAPTSGLGWPRLTALFLFFLALLNVAIASPLPQDDHVNSTLVTRGTKYHTITVGEYQKYIRTHFPSKKFIFYTGNSDTQVEKFMKHGNNKNEYIWYKSVFSAVKADGTEDFDHAWYKFFNKPDTEYSDDAEAASEALGKEAEGEVLIFGGLEYKGKQSYFTMYELDALLASRRSGKIRALKHMVRGATESDQVAATMDAEENFTWEAGYAEGVTTNNGNDADVDCSDFSSSRESSRASSSRGSSPRGGSPLKSRGTGNCDDPVLPKKKRHPNPTTCKRGLVPKKDKHGKNVCALPSHKETAAGKHKATKGKTTTGSTKGKTTTGNTKGHTTTGNTKGHTTTGSTKSHSNGTGHRASTGHTRTKTKTGSTRAGTGRNGRH